VLQIRHPRLNVRPTRSTDPSARFEQSIFTAHKRFGGDHVDLWRVLIHMHVHNRTRSCEDFTSDAGSSENHCHSRRRLQDKLSTFKSSFMHQPRARFHSTVWGFEIPNRGGSTRKGGVYVQLSANGPRFCKPSLLSMNAARRGRIRLLAEEHRCFILIER
jgi:hypothetical protein